MEAPPPPPPPEEPPAPNALNKDLPSFLRLPNIAKDATPVRVGVILPLTSSNPATRALAKASQRYVYRDFRVVEFTGRRNAGESTAQLAAEIVLRTSSW